MNFPIFYAKCASSGPLTHMGNYHFRCPCGCPGSDLRDGWIDVDDSKEFDAAIYLKRLMHVFGEFHILIFWLRVGFLCYSFYLDYRIISRCIFKILELLFDKDAYMYMMPFPWGLE